MHCPTSWTQNNKTHCSAPLPFQLQMLLRLPTRGPRPAATRSPPPMLCPTSWAQCNKTLRCPAACSSALRAVCACIRGRSPVQLQDHFSICPTCVYALLPAAPPPPAYEEAPPCSYKLTATNALLWQITTKVVPYFLSVCFSVCSAASPRLRGGPSLQLQADSYKCTARQAGSAVGL